MRIPEGLRFLALSDTARQRNSMEFGYEWQINKKGVRCHCIMI